MSSMYWYKKKLNASDAVARRQNRFGLRKTKRNVVGGPMLGGMPLKGVSMDNNTIENT